MNPQFTNLNTAWLGNTTERLEMRKTQKDNQVTVEEKHTRPLKTVGADQAFHFYTAVDKPTEHRAHSLREFLEQAETLNAESLMFHQQRRDFKNWIQNALEEPELAAKIENIKAKDKTILKSKLTTVIRAHLKQAESQADDVSVQIAERPRQITA